MLNEEKRYQLEKVKTFTNFFKIINKIKLKTIKYLNSLILNKKVIHGYGASTKGNVLLQYFNINNNYINFISDRNPKKNNCYTPGTKIKIISEFTYLGIRYSTTGSFTITQKTLTNQGLKAVFQLEKCCPNLKMWTYLLFLNFLTSL